MIGINSPVIINHDHDRSCCLCIFLFVYFVTYIFFVKKSILYILYIYKILYYYSSCTSDCNS